MNIYELFLIAIISFVLDIKTNDCIIQERYTSNKIYLNLLIHHCLHIFANFGWLLNNKKLLYLYVFSPIVCFIHWGTNNNKCTVTQQANKICGINDDEPFHDIYYLLGLKKFKYFNFIHIIYLIICLCIAANKIYYN